MSSLAASGNRVLFIENTGVRSPGLRDMPRLRSRIKNWLGSVKGIRRERENLYIYSPIILPFPYSKIARWINRWLLVSALKRWERSVGFSTPIIWTFLPTGIVLDIIDSIDSKLVIYYCIDNFAASSPKAKNIRKTESKLLERSDLVFVTAKSLYDWCSEHSKNVHTFPFGVNTEIYEKARGKKVDPPKDLAPIKHPIAGYVGGVHKWIDFDLVKHAAQANPDISFVFVGPLQADVGGLKSLTNVHFLGQKPYAELPGYVANFDVCLVPYLLTEYTKNVYPTKLNEYFSLGKAVVSTSIPEVEAYNERNGNVICIGKTKEDFSSLVKAAVSKSHDQVECKRRMDIALAEGSWKIKIEKMSALIEDEIRKKEAEKELNWKVNILKLYAGAKRKVIPLAASILAAYIILFHTPLVWWAAYPLKVENPLKKADVIAVFAGGVGESGKAGQGYEERVKYAVDLYRQGYADKLIFSSGYSYAFKEADVMKALAISLNIPESNIMLEDKAVNTYQNVINTAKIMTGRGLRSAIVISAPYNMRRVSLVWKKAALDKELIAEPVKDSLFFGDKKKVELKHIQAILHEYAGIIYYKLKGYI
jgi:uncharacterized SAM-binding protein YcdF (DUF218 family)